MSSCWCAPTDDVLGGADVPKSVGAGRAGAEQLEFVFVVDCSGSMGGMRITEARRAMKLFLMSLPAPCLFNIFRFGSSFQQLFPVCACASHHLTSLCSHALTRACACRKARS